MKDLNFDNLMSVQVIDTQTAKILGEYYIEGKITDFKLFCLGFIFVCLGLFLFNIFAPKK